MSKGRLAVVVEGGMVQSVVGTGDMIGREVVVIDYDTDSVEESELIQVQQSRHKPGTEPAAVGFHTVREATIVIPEEAE